MWGHCQVEAKSGAFEGNDRVGVMGRGGPFLRSENDTVTITHLQPMGVFPLNLTMPCRALTPYSEGAYSLSIGILARFLQPM
jgi:hypothetical protein